MILNIFVHEFEYGVGHSKAMIEVLKRIPQEEIQQLNIICYQADAKCDHFSHLGDKVKIHFVPGKGLKPFIIKSLFFQLYTLLFWRRKSGQINISMGVCSFVGDIINIQFCHFLWAKKYFEVAPLTLSKKIYKKILFKYLIACEDYVYSKKDISFVFLSNFMQEEFTKRYNIQDSRRVTSYSSADLSRFKPSNTRRDELLKKLTEEYPELKGLDIHQPISLFAGAYERKGLPYLLETLPKGHQLIVIGKGEKGSYFSKLEQNGIFCINFTKDIEKFYQACDLFIFPTLFEPFGLVIMEAAMSGMRVLVSKDYVGATEILEGMEGIETINAEHPIHVLITDPQILTKEERDSFYNKRKILQESLSWEKCSNDWLKLLHLLVNKNRA